MIECHARHIARHIVNDTHNERRDMQRFIVLTRFTTTPDLTIVNRHLVLVPIRRLFARNSPAPAVRAFTAAANDRARAANLARERRDA